MGGGDNGDQDLDIQIGEAKSNGLINLEWNDNSTILTMTTNDVAFTLQPDNEYQLRMVINKAKAAAEDDEDVNGNGYLDTGEDINNDGVLQSGLPLILGGSIDLLSGFTFTTATRMVVGVYPEVLSVTLGDRTYDDTSLLPTGGATRVPTDVTLVLEFSESMDPASVDLSTLRVTDVTGGDGSNAGFDIQIQEAINTSLINVRWNEPANTEVTLTLNAPILVPGNEYKLQMVDNQAEGDNGLPLILGGAIDLLSGFQFKTNNASVTADITLEVHMNAVNHEVLLLATDADLDDTLTFEINTNAF